MLCEYHYDTKAICDGEGRTIVRFAVCDKNKTVIRMIEQYKSVTKLDILLCPFQDGISIEKKIQLGMFFDVIFLDMEMEGITGIEVGKWLREIRKNEKTEIIYMAEDERHVVELFQNRPFDFLLKPLTEKKIFQVLDKLFRVRIIGERKFRYTIYGVSYEEQIKNILYFQSDLRTIEMVTMEKTEKFVGKLSQLEEQVVLQSFIRTHQSYLVNPEYIVKIEKKSIQLMNGKFIPISKKYSSEIKTKLQKWQEGKRR